MRGFDEHNATEAVLARLAECPDPRLKEIMTSVIRHLHAVVREVEPTGEEWMAAIRFLTETGHWCDERRQEYILLSDVLGVSMLVDAINHRRPSGATESTVLGPFHVDGAPRLDLGADICREDRGDPCFVSGRVRALDGTPLAGAKLDVWQARDDGFYDVQLAPEHGMDLRGVFHADEEGEFRFRTIRPCHYPVPSDGPVGRMLTALGRHPYRPAHLHFIVEAPGFEKVATHLFADDDDYLDSDAVFGVKDSLIKRFERHEDEAEARACGVRAPFFTVDHEFRLAPLASGGE